MIAHPCTMALPRVAVLVLLTGWVLGFGPTPVWAHPYHVTIAEAEWNPKTRHLEVALRMRPDELDRVLQHTAKSDQTERPRELATAVEKQADSAHDPDRALKKYLQTHFLVKPRDQEQAAPLRWVGKEISLKEAWLYFEVRLPDGPQDVEFEQRVLFDLERDQKNTIVFSIGGKRYTVTCTVAHPRQRLQL